MTMARQPTLSALCLGEKKIAPGGGGGGGRMPISQPPLPSLSTVPGGWGVALPAVPGGRGVEPNTPNMWGNHLAEVVRSKPRRPVHRGKRHIAPHFGPIRVPYPKGLNRLFNPL